MIGQRSEYGMFRRIQQWFALTLTTTLLIGCSTVPERGSIASARRKSPNSAAAGVGTTSQAAQVASVGMRVLRARVAHTRSPDRAEPTQARQPAVAQHPRVPAASPVDPPEPHVPEPDSARSIGSRAALHARNIFTRKPETLKRIPQERVARVPARSVAVSTVAAAPSSKEFPAKDQSVTLADNTTPSELDAADKAVYLTHSSTTSGDAHRNATWNGDAGPNRQPASLNDPPGRDKLPLTGHPQLDAAMESMLADVVPDAPRPMYRADYKSWRPPGISGIWPPDEYICDGYDRLGKVEAREDGQLVGVDPQDTVAHIVNGKGDSMIIPSNCVCIYAPRFAAVRHLTNLIEGDHRSRLGTVDQPEETLEQVNADIAHAAEQPNGPVENVVLQPPLEARQRELGDLLVTRQALSEAAFDLLPFLHKDLLAPQELMAREKAVVTDAAEAAVEWTDEVAVQLILDEQKVETQASYVAAEATYRVEEPPGRPCLKLVKLASRGQAHPGDEVDFLLQFMNTSPDTLERVTLVDNLTPRLAYVANSQECSRDAAFGSFEDEGGTLVLRWVLSEPLRPGDGGVIHFRCRVR